MTCPIAAIWLQCAANFSFIFSLVSPAHVGHVQFVYICVTPVVLTPNRCEIPRCHGCACDLLVLVRDLCAQATKSL